MTVKLSKAEKKVVYDKKLCSLLDEYSRVLIAVADNVGSNQLQNIRKGLRGDSIVLMGKNTLIRRCIKIHAEKTGNKNYLNLLSLLVVSSSLAYRFIAGEIVAFISSLFLYVQVGAPARVGLVAPIDVVVPPGNTGLDPSQTSFFQVTPFAFSQVLNIPTKINKGTVEIITPVELIKKGEKVGSSEAALLAKLGIRPFSYGLVILSVYDNGSVFTPEVLDLTEDDLIEKFAAGISMVTSLSLAISYPTLAAAPHMFINAYKNVLAVAIATEYTFPQAEKVKEYLKEREKDEETGDWKERGREAFAVKRALGYFLGFSSVYPKPPEIKGDATFTVWWSRRWGNGSGSSWSDGCRCGPRLRHRTDARRPGPGSGARQRRSVPLPSILLSVPLHSIFLSPYSFLFVGKTLFIRILRPFAIPLPILCEISSNSICSTIVGTHYVSKLQSFREDYENLMENGWNLHASFCCNLIQICSIFPK
ncbi:hypothetical protein BHM03_00009157 [Ensete ventricosum]|nr:hypothetical protein BHM03_00009157 [Ensete ventricosum]